MSNFTTELIKNLANNMSVEEIFRVELEKAFNQLLETELDCFFGYEKYSKDGYNTGDSRNGYYKRTFQTKYGELTLSIPRDRAGEFKQQTLHSHARSDDSLEQMVILMYSKSVTTREIADLIEKMYGQYYSRQTISNITQTVLENFNKKIKSQCKKKVQFPNEASLERFICGLVLEYNRESEERIHKGFALAQAQLADLFS